MESTDRPNFEDKILVCADCSAEFAFSAGEQRFFWSKGLSVPKRCPACRKLRKQTLKPSEGVRQ